MSDGITHDPTTLREGPLFTDELSSPGGIPDELRRQLNLQRIAITAPKHARKGVCAIHFVETDREWALVRYAKRYRWLFEILLNRGLAGIRILNNQGLTDEDIEFLSDIIPVPQESYSTTVYDILWKSTAASEYLDIAKTLTEVSSNEERTFTPDKLIGRHDTLSEDHHTFLAQFVRRHLIQTADDDLVHSHQPGKRSTDAIAIDPTVEYALTAEGREIVPAITAEADRILSERQFEPLLINADLDPEMHLQDRITGSAKDQSRYTVPAGTNEDSTDLPTEGTAEPKTHHVDQSKSHGATTSSTTAEHDTMNSRTEPDTTDRDTAQGASVDDRTLFDLLRSCQMGEAGAIVGGHIDRNELRQNLYVPTAEDETLTKFFVDGYERDGRLLVITGSAGDGKSALLSRAYKQALDAGNPVEESHIHMDATAATRKHETYDETLKRFLEQVSEYQASGHGPRTGLAINLGLAIDFFDRQGMSDEFPDLWNAIDTIRTQRETVTDDVHVINLGHRQLYSTRPDELGDGLLREIVEKFAFDDPESPFYEAYQRELDRCPGGDRCPLHYNATQFTNEQVRTKVAKLVAASGIVSNAYLNPRSILDHVSSMILPAPLLRVDVQGECPVGAAVDQAGFGPDTLLWNTVFQQLSGTDRTESGHIDPAAQSSISLDQQLLGWGADPATLDELRGGAPLIEQADSATQIRTVLRRLYLLDEEEIETALERPWFTEFLGALTYLNHDPESAQQDTGLQQHVSALLDTVTESLRGWSGSVDDSNYIEFVDGIKSTDYRYLSKWSPPDPNIEASHQHTREETTPGQLWLVLQPEGTTVTVPVPVTFELYQLMKRIREGYNPNALDLERSEGMRLIHSRLSEFTNKQELVRIVNKLDEELFRVERGGFNTISIKAGDR